MKHTARISLTLLLACAAFNTSAQSNNPSDSAAALESGDSAYQQGNTKKRSNGMKKQRHKAMPRHKASWVGFIAKAKALAKITQKRANGGKKQQRRAMPMRNSIWENFIMKVTAWSGTTPNPGNGLKKQRRKEMKKPPQRCAASMKTAADRQDKKDCRVGFSPPFARKANGLVLAKRLLAPG